MNTIIGPTPQELRRALHEAAEWVASYLETVGDRPVLARVSPGQIAASLPQSAPFHGEPLETILEDVDRLILPGITHWNHPSFFAYFGISGSGPGIVGELIAAAPLLNEPVEPLPAKALMIPSGVTLRTRLLPVSEMKRLPAASTTTAVGKLNCAAVVAPPLPLKP